MAEWHDIESARAQWRDAPLDDEYLQELLDASQDACLAYRPLPETEGDEVDIPNGHRLAHLAHARDLLNIGKMVPGGDLGAGEFRYAAIPMGWQTRQLLRPKRAVAAVA